MARLRMLEPLYFNLKSHFYPSIHTFPLLMFRNPSLSLSLSKMSATTSSANNPASKQLPKLINRQQPYSANNFKKQTRKRGPKDIANLSHCKRTGANGVAGDNNHREAMEDRDGPEWREWQLGRIRSGCIWPPWPDQRCWREISERLR